MMMMMIYLFTYLFKEAIFRVSIKLQEISTPIIDTTFEKWNNDINRVYWYIQDSENPPLSDTYPLRPNKGLIPSSTPRASIESFRFEDEKEYEY